MDYNKISTQQDQPVEEVEEVEETVDDEFEEAINESYIGIVNTEKLYVRSEPDADSEPLGIVTKGTELMIDEVDSEDFFMVCTETGLEGYCMKKFVDRQ